MRIKTSAAIIVAAIALAATTIASPAGAGSIPGLVVNPNPAASGQTVQVSPERFCFDDAIGVEVEVSGPVTTSYTPETSPVDGRLSWDLTFTAGPAGTYIINAACLYPDDYQEDYLPATLQVTGGQDTTTSTGAPSSSTTAAPADTAAAAATAAAATPRFTG
jgi:hypothetical protein